MVAIRRTDFTATQLIAPADRLATEDGRNAAYCRGVTAPGSHSERWAEERRVALGVIDEDRTARQMAIWFEALGGGLSALLEFNRRGHAALARR